MSSDAGLFAVNPEEREEMLRQMAVRRYSPLTKATVLETAVNLGAQSVVYGQFTFQPAGERQTGEPMLKGAITIQANVLHVRRMAAGPSFVVNGSVDNLSALQSELAWRVVRALQPEWTLTQDEFLRRHPPVRLDALESYIRGMLADAPDQKLRFFGHASRLEPEFSQPCFQLGRIHLGRRDYKAAAEWLKRVSPRDSHYREALFDLGLCQHHTGDYSGAAASLAQVAATVPLSEVLNNLGLAQMRLTDPAAGDTLKRAVEANPADPDVHFNAGYLLWKRGRWEEAADYFRSTLKRRPEDQDATLLLGRCLSRSGPREGEVRTEGLERLKRHYNEGAWLALQSVLAPRKQALP